MLDPHTRNVEFYVRNDQGKYIQILIDGEGIYRSVIVEGFWLRIEWLWQNPLPDHFDVARELGLIP